MNLDQNLIQEIKENLQAIKEKAGQGDAMLQCILGMCYFKGINVEQSYEESVKWLRLSAEQGNASAQDMLSICYDEGFGVTQSHEEAITWLMAAAKQGNVKSQSSLAYHYAKGMGVEQSYEEAATWYLQAAEQGDVDAQFSIGSYYEDGKGVAQSYEEAVKWYRLAAEQGDAQAQYNLGAHYAIGRGVPQSLNDAVKWLQLSAEQGYENAKKLISEIGMEESDSRDLSDLDTLIETIKNQWRDAGIEDSEYAKKIIAQYHKMRETLLNALNGKLSREGNERVMNTFKKEEIRGEHLRHSRSLGWYNGKNNKSWKYGKKYLGIKNTTGHYGIIALYDIEKDIRIDLSLELPDMKMYWTEEETQGDTIRWGLRRYKDVSGYDYIVEITGDKGTVMQLQRKPNKGCMLFFVPLLLPLLYFLF